MITGVIFGTFLLAVFFGVPIALSLVLGTVVPLTLFSNVPVTVIMQKMFASIDSYSLMAVPFYIIAGGFLDKGGVSKRLVNLADALVGWLPGGLAVVTFLASAFFGAISGSAAATVAAIGGLLYPSMIERGYDQRFSLATISIGGILGIIIPPSIPMVLFGISASVDVSKIFLGGIIPGILLVVAMSIYSVIYGKRHNLETKKFELRALGRALKDAIWALLMPLIILGGIYAGIMTPTEAAAVAIIYGLIVGLCIYRELSAKMLVKIVTDAVASSGQIMFIVAGASAFGYVMTRENVPTKVANFITGVAGNYWVFYLLVILLLLFVGTFMEVAPATMLLSPILVPCISAYSINPVVFAVIFVCSLGVGLVTPPVGLNLYVAANIGKVKFEKVVSKHLFIYMLCYLAVVVLLVIFPQIVNFLPSHM